MNEVCVTVEAGICGFSCIINAQEAKKRTVQFEISDSECKQIQRLSHTLNEIKLKELFMPLTRNPIFISAERAGCHPACPIPAAVVKTVEVAMGMALPQDVQIQFDS